MANLQKLKIQQVFVLVLLTIAACAPTVSTAAYLVGYIHVTGGKDLFGLTVSNQHQVLDLATMAREQWPDLPGGRHGLTSQAVTGKWTVIGGSPIPNIGMSSHVDIFIP